jgi:hypothetical protein
MAVRARRLGEFVSWCAGSRRSCHLASTSSLMKHEFSYRRQAEADQYG